MTPFAPSNSNAKNTFIRQFSQAAPRRIAIVRRRAAYTLLEVLIALALSLILLGAVYHSLRLYWSYSTAGQDEIQQLQVARAVMQKMESDIYCLTFQPQAAASGSSSTSGSSSSGSSSSGSSSSAGGSASGSSSSSSSSSSTSQTVQAAGTNSRWTQGGLFGDNHSLLIHVNKPGRDPNTALLATASSGAPTRISDLQTVAYFMAGQTGGSLQALAAVQGASGQGTNGQGAGNASAATSTTGASHGIARLQGDRLAMESADASGNMGALASRTEILAPEVTFLQFQYYDGLIWRQTWDSSVSGLPKAVEIIFELSPPPSQTTGSRLTGTQTTGSGTAAAAASTPLGLGQLGLGQRFRSVVPMPLCPPVRTTGY